MRRSRMWVAVANKAGVYLRSAGNNAKRGCDQLMSLVNRKLWARGNGWVGDDENEGSLPIGRPCGKM